MGFFKDFKEDFSDAVNELVPGGDSLPDDEVMVNTLEEDFNAEKEIAKLDGLLEQVAKKVDDDEIILAEEPEEEVVEEEVVIEPVIEPVVAPVVEPVIAPVPKVEPVFVKEEVKMDTTVYSEPVVAAPKISDEVGVITPGMTITGDIVSTGSVEIQGTISGSVMSNGKLTVTGTVNGNSQCSEFFADSAKVEGEVVTSGTAKVGVGSIIIGNISATSAVIAGAVKGDIDVQGPVVVDTSAVVMGNIKSRSVQINNGAVIEGFCSQSYSDIDVASVFSK